MGKIAQALLSLCIFSVIGGTALWLCGSDKMKQTLRLCLSALALSMIFSLTGKIDFENEFDFKSFDASGISLSQEDIADGAGEAVCSVCKNILSLVCEEEPEIYYDCDVLTVVLTEKDSGKIEQVKEILINTVQSDVRVIAETIE